MKTTLTIALVGVMSAGWAVQAQAEEYITLASTTSTENSGLFDAILPPFEEATDIEVRVVAVGTGQAFEIARRGDADSLLVHDTAGEETFVENGYASERADVMYNDFVLIGPASDPAGIADAQSAAEALA
ncbi:MAG: substrate-binding domain-containing protein, partial [Pseudomonadota bacterium]